MSLNESKLAVKLACEALQYEQIIDLKNFRLKLWILASEALVWFLKFL